MLIFLIIYYIACWKLFIKMKLFGWECLLPVYSDYLVCKKGNVNKKIIIIYLIVKSILVFLGIIYLIYIFLFLVIGPILQFLVLSGSFNSINWSVFLTELIAFGILCFFYMIMRCYVYYKLFLMFVDDRKNAIILGIFNFIGVMILGFDNSVYVENKNVMK